MKIPLETKLRILDGTFCETRCGLGTDLAH
jgi:hypothetical protein